jgi:peptide/nickel transport system substrate-binding protein
VDELKVTAASLVHSKPMQTTGFGVLNSSRPPFDHLQVRRAFSYAVDRAEIVRLMGGRSVATETCQLLPPSMPSYAPYCPYTRGPRDGHYHGPDLAKARELVRRSGTYGMKVTVTQLVGDYNPPFDSYFTHVLRQLGYRATLRRLPDTRRNEDFFFTSRRGSQVVSGGWIADFPLPSNFYDIVSCGANAYPSFYCNKSLDRQAAAATAMLQSDPGRALRTWTAIDRKVTDEAALMPVQNSVDWWVTSKRVGNYQSSERDVGPLMSQLWVR